MLDESPKISQKSCGLVKAYAAMTQRSQNKNYNSDRISIVTNLLPPRDRKDEFHIPHSNSSRENTDDTVSDQELAGKYLKRWPRCSYFGIFDGHNGLACAEFLRDNFHKFIIKLSCFPEDPKLAIRQAAERADQSFLQQVYDSEESQLTDPSGASFVVVLLIDNYCYVANVGSSRAILGTQDHVFQLTQDHIPSCPKESARILLTGGEIYSQDDLGNVHIFKKPFSNEKPPAKNLRVFPGCLQITRCMGDAEVKLPELGANPLTITCEPEIVAFSVQNQHDIITIATDGVFNKLSNDEVSECIGKAVHSFKYELQNLHQILGKAAETILKNSVVRGTDDNASIILISLSSLQVHEQTAMMNVMDKSTKIPGSCIARRTIVLDLPVNSTVNSSMPTQQSSKEKKPNRYKRELSKAKSTKPPLSTKADSGKQTTQVINLRGNTSPV